MQKVTRDLLYLLLFLFQACDLTDPGERIYNEKAVPPVTKILNIRDMYPGQHVAGTLVFTFTPDTLVNNIEMLYCFVDSAIVPGSSIGTVYTFQIDTRQWEQGTHLILIGLREPKPNTGLLGLAGVPTVLYSIPLVFDQTPPTSVRLVSLAWDNGSPLLQWAQNHDLNFYSYRIWRGGNWGQNTPYFDYGQIHEIDSVLVQAQTSYRDLAMGQLIGLDVRYCVAVSNRDQSATSDTLEITYGNSAPVPFGDVVTTRPLRDPLRDVLYVLGDDTLTSFDSPTHSQLHSTTFAGNQRCLTMNHDGTLLFVLGWVPTLTVVNPGNLSVISSKSLSATWSGQFLWAEGGLSNRVYIATFSNAKPIKVIDGISGNTLEEPGFLVYGPIPYPFDAGPLAMSPDRSTAFVRVRPWQTGAQDTVYRLDVSAATVKVITKRAVAATVNEIQVSPDGQQLYVLLNSSQTQTVEVWDAATLATRGDITLPGPVSDIVAGPTSLYIAHSLPSAGGSSFETGGRVAQYSYSSWTSSASWDFVSPPTLLQVSLSEHTVLALANPYYYTRHWWEIRK